ncbi:dynein axonemal assembly factor 8-like isoform X2 [Dreissena polymorpha]|uniref:dynein axonemal assembly factor 8-like isoform X2 n=1 Tax=Dreissena polymorpha TaxID=45954 RepID=UPI002263BA06|nr:dynein axonemal assembly factor 8-like isoform X2 [Dreissena polymorpha]
MVKHKGTKRKMAHTAAITEDEVKTQEGAVEVPGGSQDIPFGLKPKLDKIFKEVVENLPDIDFDLSDDYSGDEDVTPMTFNHPIKSLEEDKDLDTSQSSESLLDLSNISSNKDEDNDTSFQMRVFDNDLAYELQKSGINITPPTVSAWSDIPIPREKDKNRQESPVLSWNDMPKTPSDSGDKNMEKTVDKNKKKIESDASYNKLVTESYGQLSLNSMDDKLIRRQLSREANRNKDREMATSIISPRAPVLSTEVLENIDIDALLQNLNTDNQSVPSSPKQAWVEPVSRPANHMGARENRNLNENSKTGDGLTLIQRLAKMSMSQYGCDLTDIDPSTGARKKNTDNSNNNRNQADAKLVDGQEKSTDDSKADGKWAVKVGPADTGKKQTASCGTSTSNEGQPLRVIIPRIPPKSTPPTLPTAPNNLQGPMPGSKDPTVYIDLRNFEQLRQEQQQSIERVQQVLGIQHDHMLVLESSDSEEDPDDWRLQRQKFKQHTFNSARQTKKTYTASDKPPMHRPPPRVINMSELPSRTQRSQSEEGPVEASVPQRSPPAQRQEGDVERERQADIIRKLREKQESERQTKLRLQKRLEALRPAASVSSKHDPAEATHTLFDMEASYEAAPRNLPPVLTSDTDCVLLAIHLSSNGEIVLHRGSGNKSVDTGTGLSASYTTLLSWLLTLVPQDFTYLQGGAAGTQSPWVPPFHVVGLQQGLLDDQLCLMVAATPVEQFDGKGIQKSKKNKKSDRLTNTAFHQHLQKYLATNTLHTVCPWLQNMVSMDVTPGGEGEGISDDTPNYAYRPPLPNITTKPLSTFIHVNPDPQAASKVFNTAVGFFWQTVDSDETKHDQDIHDKDVNYDTQNTLSLIYKKIYQDPSAIMGVFNRVLQLGLDISGIRLVYPSPEQMNMPKADNASVFTDIELLNNIGAVLAVCVRGTCARMIWLDAVGPSDPVLARKTDPNSLCALYGGDSRDECLLFCPRTPARVHTELVRWFGGRVPPGNVIDVGTPYTKKDNLRSGSPKGRRNKKVTFADDVIVTDGEVNNTVHRPLATLTATTKSEIMLVISPLVPPKCFGIILASCQRRGFQVTGVRRVRLSSKKAAALGITGAGLKTFCPGSLTSESFDASLAGHVDPQGHRRWVESTFPSTILQLLKENATHSAASLVEDCMVQLTRQGIMGALQKREQFPLESAHMFHAARFSEGLLATLGGEFSKCYDPEVQINPSYVIPQLYTNPELEQITVLLLLGHNILKSSGILIGRLLGMVPYSRQPASLPFLEGLELLGLKWLPRLSVTQAKEVTPCEVGDRLWKDSLHTLAGEPCLVLALRGVNAFAKLETIVPPRPTLGSPGNQFNLEMIHTRTAEEAYTFIRQFFTERELFSDPLSRPMLPYIPQYYHEFHVLNGPHEAVATYPKEESIFEMMQSGPRPFPTFLLIKPRALHKHLTKILKKLAQENFCIVALKLLVLSREQAQRVIPEEVKLEEDRTKHLQYLTGGPSLCLCVERENAVKRLLDLLGPEDPQSARRLSQFYWRGVFGGDIVTNALYGSKNYRQAIDDVRYFFPAGLCCQESDIHIQELIQSPAVDIEIDIKYNTSRDILFSKMEVSEQDSSHLFLNQTTCLILMPVLMKKFGSHFGYVEVIEGLVHQGFELVGGRMVWFTQEQAEHALCALDAGSFQQVPFLVSGPSIVLAVQRDNAVLAFDTILRETFSTETNQGRSVTDSILHKYGRFILRPNDIKQASDALRFFFNRLTPDSQAQIIPLAQT